MPKFNLYQSLHTTVVGPDGRPVEVQIRTQEMHRRAEFGIAAHWGYKERSPAEDLAWLQRMVDWEQDTSDPTEFLETLKVDLEQDEVYVFTPKGQGRSRSPTGATPVDFAYAIHTEVGHRCIGAQRERPARAARLEAQLGRHGRDLHLARSRRAGPSLDWLQFVHTPGPRSKIRQWFSRERREDAMDAGREELAKALRREGLPVQKLSRGPARSTGCAQALQLQPTSTRCYAAIGEGHVSARAVAQRVAAGAARRDEEQLPVTTARPPRAPAGAERARRVGVYVEGLDDVMVRLSRCCTPVPGDEIMGFVTRGRGVLGAPRRLRERRGARQPDRSGVIEVEWDDDETAAFLVSVEVEALDRSRLLPDVDAGARRAPRQHPERAAPRPRATGCARMRFEFELADPSHLDSILRTARAGRRRVRRLPAAPGPPRRQLSKGATRLAYDHPMAEAEYRAPVGTHDVLPPDSARWRGPGRALRRRGRTLRLRPASSPRSSSTSRCSSGIGDDHRRRPQGDVRVQRPGRPALSRCAPRAPRRSCGRSSSTGPPSRGRSGTSRPTFRYERPQAGRYRQHHQLGVEVLGVEDPDVDVEVIALAHGFYRELGLRDVALRLNSMGDARRAGPRTSRTLQRLPRGRTPTGSAPSTATRAETTRCASSTASGRACAGGDRARPPARRAPRATPCAAHFARVQAGLDALGVAYELDAAPGPRASTTTRAPRSSSPRRRSTRRRTPSAAAAATTGSPRSSAARPTPGIGFGIGIERLLHRVRRRGRARPRRRRARRRSSSTDRSATLARRSSSTSCATPASAPTGRTTGGR